MTAFRVGQKVVCINNAGHLCGNGRIWVGTVYTIRDIRNDLLYFVEPEPVGGWEAPRFRPVSYPKQSEAADVALVKSLLDPVAILDGLLEELDTVAARRDLP